MQLIDKDLLSMQEVRELVEAAKVAQRELAAMNQEQVDRIVRAIAEAGVRNARRGPRGYRLRYRGRQGRQERIRQPGCV